jgi:hypothetical protein
MMSCYSNWPGDKMIIPLEDKYKEHMRNKVKGPNYLKLYDKGVELEPPWEHPIKFEDLPFTFVKGSHGSQVCADHTSINNAEFHKFAMGCKGLVAVAECRLVFERETMIGFTESEDATLFMLTWG